MSIIPEIDWQRVDTLIDLAVSEDLGDLGDTTTIACVPENAKSKVAEYIIRANYHDLYGAFDMIYDDGCIRYKILLSVNDLLNDSFAEANLSKARIVSMMAWQKHIENLFRLINGKTGNKSVAQLIEEC